MRSDSARTRGGSRPGLQGGQQAIEQLERDRESRVS
jgi:hypothetical protein